MECLNCNKETSNPKFCSSSCSATFSNKSRKRSVQSKNKTSESLKKTCDISSLATLLMTELTLDEICKIMGFGPTVLRRLMNDNNLSRSRETLQPATTREPSANSKRIGNIAESRFIFECTRRHIDVSLPFGDCARYDAIADVDGTLFRIQIKTLRKLSDGVYDFYTRSNSVKNESRKSYVGQIDYFFAYNDEDDVYVLVPIDDVGDKYSMTVRNTSTKSNMMNGIHFIEKYQNFEMKHRIIAS